MGKKHKHPEHINLERWLISYADFITLLFATFVVLYALSQVDIKDFKALEDSMKQAFAAPSIMQGSDNIMDASDSIMQEEQADSMISPLMMEYMSQKYEEQSMNEIKKDIEDMSKSGELQGVEAEQTDRGLVIRFKDGYLFPPASAELSPVAKEKLDKVGAIVAKKFILHSMRVEGHTDNQAFKSPLYPSNWELSGARSSAIIRYLIFRFRFLPSVFTAVGFGDTRPIESNSNESGRAKNRRVEIVILKNQFKSQESSPDAITKMSKQEQAALQSYRLEAVNKILNMSEAAKKLAKGSTDAEKNAIILNQAYEKELKRISKETSVLEPDKKNQITGQGSWLKPPGGADSVSSLKRTNIRNEIDKEFKSVGQ